MPLEFQTISHGPVAFGFFNIQTDLLLLEHYFLYASDFCRQISLMAREDAKDAPLYHWETEFIQKAEDMGDLMGAIHGIRYLGFIGEVYRRFPFPDEPAEFRQSPEGFENRGRIQEIIEKYAKKTSLTITPHEETKTLEIGEYIFSREEFHELLDYVWLGGYPRWKDGIRPGYVMHMKVDSEKSRNWLFKGMVFTREKIPSIRSLK
jgi:hypothetical protein